MRLRLALLLTCALLLAPLAASAQQPTIAVTNLKVGEMAPDFTLLDNHWHPVKLSSFRGKSTVVLAFYVLAFTSGWKQELQAYQADMPKLKANDTVVLGLSKDSPAANNAFAQQIGVTFPLLSDMNGTVMEQYGILKKNDVQGQSFEWARRTTFVVDKQGIIRHIQQGTTAINPNSAVAICLDLHGKSGNKK